MNYYNDNDSFAAAWLEELIRAGELRRGSVDARSIIEVVPSDLGSFRQCHFFAGIGGWARALELAGWPEERECWTASLPCQPLSVAGARQGALDGRHLWPAFYRLVAVCRPPIIFGEQVASADGREWFAGVRTDLEGAGYACGAAIMPASAVGAPHRRERLWWCAVEHASWRRHGDADEAIRAGRACIEPSGGDGRVADAAGEQVDEKQRRSEADEGERCSDGSGGCNMDSFWDDAEWRVGADGKARRVKPGVRLLAHGVPNRVGALRGFGNAIVPQVAAEFIMAMMEVMGEE